MFSCLNNSATLLLLKFHQLINALFAVAFIHAVTNHRLKSHFEVNRLINIE
jgi:hypothetical protein